MKTHLVIDGDLIAFKCSAANETRSIIALHKASGREKEFKNRTELKAFLEGTKFSAEDFQISDVQKPSEISHCLFSVRRMVENIVEMAKADTFEVVISGSGNFRESLELPSKYKGNRDDTIRPVHLKEVQNYIKKKYQTIVTEGIEADDYLSHRTYQGWKLNSLPDGHVLKQKIVGATIDKDAVQTPGWLFNWDKMQEPIFVDGYGSLSCKDKGKVEGLGRKFLYYQMLFGDPTDHYKPCEIAGVKYGPVGAYNDLAECRNDREAWEAMALRYKSWYPEPVKYSDWQGKEHVKTWWQIMQMYADCAFMQRWHGDRIDVQKVLAKYGIEE